MYLAVGGERPTVYRFVSPTRLEVVPKALQGKWIMVIYLPSKLVLMVFSFFF